MESELVDRDRVLHLRDLVVPLLPAARWLLVTIGAILSLPGRALVFSMWQIATGSLLFLSVVFAPAIQLMLFLRSLVDCAAAASIMSMPVLSFIGVGAIVGFMAGTLARYCSAQLDHLLGIEGDAPGQPSARRARDRHGGDSGDSDENNGYGDFTTFDEDTDALGSRSVPVAMGPGGRKLMKRRRRRGEALGPSGPSGSSMSSSAATLSSERSLSGAGDGAGMPPGSTLRQRESKKRSSRKVNPIEVILEEDEDENGDEDAEAEDDAGGAGR